VDRLTLDEIELAWREIEAALDLTCDIDRWCSGPDWVVPVHLGFAPDSELLLLTNRSAADPGYALLARYRLADDRTMIAGLEPLWGFASPVLAADPEGFSRRLAPALAATGRWDVLVLPGMPDPRGPSSYAAQVVRGLAPLGRVNVGRGITRQVADLRDGYGAWLARRTSRFRRNLRQARHRAGQVGLEIVDAGDGDGDEPDVFDRLLAIEKLSWKGQDRSGITSPEMAATYRMMVDRLAARRRLRVSVARLGGRDVGYILGGVRARRYRGLQLSYATEASALSVGHLLQDHQIRALCEGDEADAYDLGMDLDYKRRWADRQQPSFTLVIDRG
jgi:CelD/BcsL family acetyltransferase involved in cellulose biosynthesis